MRLFHIKEIAVLGRRITRTREKKCRRDKNELEVLEIKMHQFRINAKNSISYHKLHHAPLFPFKDRQYHGDMQNIK